MHGLWLCIMKKEQRKTAGRGMGLACLALCLAGCGGETASKSDSQTTDKEGNPLTAPVDYLGAVNQAKKSADKKLSLVGLQKAIQQFQVSEGRLPRNLQEVVSSGHIARLPEAPKGSRWVYDPRTGVVSTSPN